MSSQDTLVVHPYLSAQHILFQNADITTPHDVGLRCYCDLLLSEHKRSEIEDEGKADATASGLSFETTSQHVRFIRSSVPLWTEAGGRILTNIILLHVISTLHSTTSRVEVIPEFPVTATFIKKMDFGNRSFSGLVDFVLVRVSPGLFSNRLRSSPIHALTATKNMPDTLIIICTEKNNLYEALPQATITAASYCKQQRSPDALGDVAIAGEFQHGKDISLGNDLENLALVIGLLRDSTNNACKYEQKYFLYIDEI
ncbi:hypothetical protein BGW80DRAFT_1442406 [Lactifluus volemus]|nr:hypothetical protein BGW80DRAFT_1442406 [Lactifluus volemus]